MAENVITETLDFSSCKNHIFGVPDENQAAVLSASLKSGEKAANKLCAFISEKSAMGDTSLFTSSFEAAAGTMKVATDYSSEKYAATRNEILFLGESSFKFFSEKVGYIFNLRYAFCNHIGNFIASLSEKTCAVVIDLIDEKTAVDMPKDFVKLISEVCESRDILLFVNETLSGFGRTESYFAFGCYSIMPDCFFTLDVLGNGIALSSVSVKEDLKDYLSKTPVGTDVIAAGALYCVKAAENCAESVKKKNKAIVSALKLCKKVVKFSGTGIYFVLEVNDGKEILKQLKAQGLKLSADKNKLYFAPPVNVSEEDVKKATAILKDVLKGNAVNPFDA